MKEIELYDIITLDNDEEYTVVKEIKEKDKTYYLLVPVDEEEEPDVENIRIVEKIIHRRIKKRNIKIRLTTQKMSLFLFKKKSFKFISFFIDFYNQKC